MKKNIIITLSKLSSPSGVSSFWNAVLPFFYKLKSINTNTFEIGGHGINIFAILLDQWNFKKILNNEIDLVILNPSLGFRSFFRDGLFAKQLVKKKVPFVVFFHGWDLEFEKRVSKRYVKFFLNSIGKAEKIFVLSCDFKIKLLEWGYNGDILVETTTVDSKLLVGYDYSQNDKNNEKIKILFLSRLLKEKGIYETIEAFKQLRKKYQSIELTIAGDGSEYEKLKEFVKYDNHIEMTGHVEGKQKIDLFKKCHIYCLPSYTEGLPISVLEAMAFGLPIITSSVGGLKDFFQDGEMGYFVEPKNSKQLEGKLNLLLSDKNQMAEMGMYNFNYAHNNLISPMVAKRLYSHIEELLD